MSSAEDRATATGDMYRNVVKYGHVVYETSERTDRQTYTLIAILRTTTGGEVITTARSELRNLLFFFAL